MAQINRTANAVARHDALEFLSDIVPRTLPFKVVKARAKARGNPPPGATVEPGQTTLDSKTPLVNGNGANGLGLDNSTDETVDDEARIAGLSVELEMEIRGTRTGTGQGKELNGNRTGNGIGKNVQEDVQMS